MHEGFQILQRLSKLECFESFIQFSQHFQTFPILLMFSNCQNFFFLADCLASYATETVMQYCHGRRRCNLTADQKTFGKPCMPESRMYLKVVYTCGKFLLMKLRASSWCCFQQLPRFANERWKETKRPLQWRNESQKLSSLVPVIDLWFPIKEKLPLSQQSRNDSRMTLDEKRKFSLISSIWVR